MALAENQKRHLRQLGHSLRPVVMVGQAGLTDAVLAEADNALNHHELIKMRLNASDREARIEMITRVVAALNSDLVQTIGHIALFYRPHPENPKIVLPGPRKPAR